MDPYFERAIHGLSKHKMTHRVVLNREQASPIVTSSKFPPAAGNECPFLIGARCRRFECYSDMHMCIT